MKLKTALLALGIAFSANAALALTAEEIVTDLQGQGYTRVEVKVGATQIKVEAIRGTEKFEAVYDIASGQPLKTETETVDGSDDTSPGVEIRQRSGDFVRSSGNDRDEDDEDDHGSSVSSSDDDHDDDHGGSGSSHDDDDDDSDDDHDSDDDSDDDHDDDHDSNDDHDSDDD